MKELVDRNYSRTPIADDDWQEIENAIFVIIRDVETQIKETCAAHIISVRERAGLAPITVVMNIDINDWALKLGSSLWSPSEITDACPPRLLAYDELLDRHRLGAYQLHLGDFSEPRESMPPMSFELPSTAYALILSMGLPDTITMEEMTSFGERFVCKCCDHDVNLGTKWSWKDLVRVSLCGRYICYSETECCLNEVAHFVRKIRNERSSAFLGKELFVPYIIGIANESDLECIQVWLVPGCKTQYLRCLPR